VFFFRAGQNWGLAPINPLALRRRGFAPVIAALRANMRHAGVLRIDHVMSLQRLYWVPSGCPATSGAYVNYPFRDLLRLVALESRRHGCASSARISARCRRVSGDDAAGECLSYQLRLRTPRRRQLSLPAATALAAASAATHDLAT
jgi:hypothetical protein